MRRYYITYVGEALVRINWAGLFQHGTSAWVSEEDAREALSRSGFVVDGDAPPGVVPVMPVMPVMPVVPAPPVMPVLSAPPVMPVVPAAAAFTGVAQVATKAQFVETRRETKPASKKSLAQKALKAIRGK